MSRVVCIVQARMGSKRLPGKVLLPLNGHTVIAEVLIRCERIAGVDEVVCAIPFSPENDRLAQVAQSYASVFRGNEDDVLNRYYEAAKLHKADIIMRITGDCPLICPELCNQILSERAYYGADYASNIEPRTFPQGLDCEVFTRKALERALNHGADQHVTTWMRTDASVLRVNVASPWLLEGRLTLDTEDDYRAICAYFGHEPYQRLRAA